MNSPAKLFIIQSIMNCDVIKMLLDAIAINGTKGIDKEAPNSTIKCVNVIYILPPSFVVEG